MSRVASASGRGTAPARGEKERRTCQGGRREEARQSRSKACRESEGGRDERRGCAIPWWGSRRGVLDAQAAQYVQQFRPMFRAEYYFIRNTCGLNADQRKQLARMGETAVKAAARQFVETQQKMMRGGWRPGTDYPDPRKLVEQELTRVMSPLLSHDQESRYKAELEKRAASRKQVVIDNLVAKLDGDLVLSSEQRTRLVEALSANWKDAWGQSLQMLMNIDSFFPNIPDQVVAPILTDNQKEVWRRIPKNSNVFWGFTFGGGIVENDPLDDPELAEARKEAEARDKK